jgi:ribosome-associated protein
MRNRNLLVDPKPPAPVEYTRPSKSQMKRDSTALQVLGRRIADLPKDRIAQLNLPERLHEAFLAYKTITAHEGGRRQLQFIGRLMRDVEPAPLIEALDRFNGASKAEVAAMHLAERWRDRLLEDATALTEFATAHPGSDIARLRTLMRNAQKEKAAGKPPKDFRELYRELRTAIDARANTAADEAADPAPAGEPE